MFVRDAVQRQSGEVVQTILFADLCGFTEYTRDHGDERAADMAVSFHRSVHALAQEDGCSAVKPIGDAVMVRSTDCKTALRLACRILALGEHDGCLPIRVGLDSGPVVEREGDWYGTTVNAAARVADAATPGELLLTERAREAIAGTATVKVSSPAVRRLKGLPMTRVHAASAA
jgi:adenylate cyclase